MQNKQKVVQLLGDLAIPVLGFYLWNWNIYFILLFFCLDMIGGEIALHLKAKKIIEVQKGQTNLYWKTFGFVSLLVLCLNIVFIHFGMYVLHPEFDLFKEIVAFLSFTELGIQQGYVLLPIIALMVFFFFYAEFLLPRKYLTIGFKELFKRSIQLKIAILIFNALSPTLHAFF